MSRFLENLPLQRKLSLVIMAACLLTLLPACVVLFGIASYRLTTTFVRDVAALAEVVAANCTGPVAFHDRKAAGEMLAALGHNPQITAACLRLPDQSLFATLGPVEKFPRGLVFPVGQGSYYLGDELFLSQPVVSDGEVLGTLHLRANVRGMRRELIRFYAGILGLVLAGSLSLAYLLSTRLQKIISVPILRLTATARSIAEHKDYSVRASRLGRDEVGLLTDAFNLMLAQIETQDDALQKARRELERQIDALSASEAKYRSVVNDIREVVFQTDAAGNWTLLNPAWADITGFSIEESLGRNIRDFLHPDDLASDLGKFRLMFANRPESVRHEVRYRTKTGGVRWTEVYARRLTGPDGETLGITGVLHDITERKRAQAELDALNRQLIDSSRKAGMAEIATGVLHNVGNVLNSLNVSSSLIATSVRHSKAESLAKLAELLNEHAGDLGEFLTHDPRGRRLPELIDLLAGHLSAERSHLTAEITSLQSNISHIREIISRQQAYASAGSMAESLEAPGLVEDALRMQGDSIARHQIRIVRDFQPAGPVLADRARVLQILVNLISNAKNACKERGVADRVITLSVLPGPDNHVWLTVRDNGIGITRENLNRIFAHGFTTRATGHGFGLHSAAIAAREMKGALTAHSDGPGRGATFTLELPLAATPGGVPAEAGKPGVPGA